MSPPPSFTDEPKTFHTPAGPLAYTDIGSGPPVVFLHGNPTSAHLFRYLIDELATDHRCIAPDYVGFGRSAAPSDFSYRPPAHATLIEALLQHLDTTNITLVLHDWGGPIGMAYALRHPEAIRRVVLMNTWAWPLEHRPLIQIFARLVNTRLGRRSIEDLNAFARFAMPLTVGSTGALVPEWVQTYAAALHSRQRRYACWAFARALHTESTWLRALWTCRHRLQDRPALLCWGMADPAFGVESCLQRWVSLFPAAEVHRFSQTGHYVPEERGPALQPLVRRFFQRTS